MATISDRLQRALLALGILDAHRDSALGNVDIVRGWTRADDDVHFLLAQGPLHRLLNFLILRRNDVADERGGNAVTMIDRGPFQPGCPAAADDDALGRLLQHHGMVGTDHCLAVEGNALDRPGPGTGVDDDRLGPD